MRRNNGLELMLDLRPLEVAQLGSPWSSVDQSARYSSPVDQASYAYITGTGEGLKNAFTG
jgi:hypothetical protein